MGLLGSKNRIDGGINKQEKNRLKKLIRNDGGYFVIPWKGKLVRQSDGFGMDGGWYGSHTWNYKDRVTQRILIDDVGMYDDIVNRKYNKFVGIWIDDLGAIHWDVVITAKQVLTAVGYGGRFKRDKANLEKMGEEAYLKHSQAGDVARVLSHTPDYSEDIKHAHMTDIRESVSQWTKTLGYDFHMRNHWTNIKTDIKHYADWPKQYKEEGIIWVVGADEPHISPMDNDGSSMRPSHITDLAAASNGGGQ